MTERGRVDAKWLAKALTPPIVIIGAKRLLRALGLLRPEPPPVPAVEPEADEPPEWEYVAEGWERPTRGWEAGTVAEAYLTKWPEWVEALRGSGPLGVYHEARAGELLAREDMAAHNMLLSFAYVLARAAQGRERLSVLDWGGALGHYAVLAKAVLPEVAYDWHCREVESIAAAGRSVNPAVTFHADDNCLNRSYDLVFVSASLQYAPDWRGLLHRLGAAAGSYLFVTRLPLALRSPSFVVLQRANAYGYASEYLGWVLSRDEFLEEARARGLTLERELLLDAWLSAAGAPESPTGHRGFLFRPDGNSTIRP